MFEHLGKLPPDKKVYFASDMHFGAPSRQESLPREKSFTRWLEQTRDTAAAYFLLGDVFDFWFEYKKVVPRGFTRLLGTLADISDDGVKIYMFTGNHDMWMSGYFEEELNITVLHDPVSIDINNKSFFIGHGDGLGPGDRYYKILKRIFRNKTCRWVFARLHPNLAFTLAHYWSGKSRLHNMNNSFNKETDFLFQFCINKEQTQHHDYYVLGHRHFPVKERVGESGLYFNLGDWIDHFTFGEFDGNQFKIKTYSDS